jgi:hypothetical protein
MERVKQVLGESFSGFENDSFIQFGSTPANINAGGIHSAHRRLSDLGTNAIAGN